MSNNERQEHNKIEPPRRQDAKKIEIPHADTARGGDLRSLYEPSSVVDSLAHDVIGAAIEVHRILGPGYLESVYEEALCIEFRLRGIPFQRQAAISVKYKGYSVGESRVDLLVNPKVLVDQKLLVELKAAESHNKLFEAQVLSYLKTTGLHLGLLINFNVIVLKDGIKRVVNS